MARADRDAAQADRLRRIEAVTDSALAHLDVPDLLNELLERVRELLDSDTAAVLLLDEESKELVATSASGIEEEVRQGVRIPLGEGFAGRIAAEAAPVIIDDVDHAVVRNPLLRALGIKSLLGVPLIAEGRVIGVLHVGSLTRRDFGATDIDLLRLVADRAALAVDAGRSNAERAAAAALQRSLIPGRFPAIAGLEFAGRYLPGDEGGVGGDWYDVFTLPSGRVGVVIGDVVGRGLEAAVVMGRLRSALRAYALETFDPSDVVARLDRKLQHFEAGQLTTVLYGILDPAFDTITLCSAGHLLPVLANPGCEPVWLKAPVDPPLGVAAGMRRRSVTVDLAPGALLAFFTDGLVERPGMVIDENVDRLRASLVPGSAEHSCVSAIAALVGGDSRRDDVALLVLRRDDHPGKPIVLDVPAAPASLRQIRGALRRWLAWAAVDDEIGHRLLLAVGEAASNAIEHAYGPADGVVIVEVAAAPGGLAVTVRDTGHWRRPRGNDRGRGLQIMRKCADEMTVNRSPEGTEVHLWFRIEQ